MGARDNLQRLIDKKKQEIDELEKLLRDANTYLSALCDAQKTLPREHLAGSGSIKTGLRPGTMLFRIREIIRDNGQPMHINDLLKALGRPLVKSHRVSVSGSLAAYVRNGNTFTRPKPNTFGLAGLPDSGETVMDDIPEDFGT